MHMPAIHLDRDPFHAHLAALDEPAALVLVDCDGFAEMNEAFGRSGGDRILKVITSHLLAGMPDGTEVCRTGGDEFACLLPGSSPESALIAIDTVRRDLALVHGEGGTTTGIGISAGVAAIPHHTADGSRLMTLADQALHRAKTDGGGRASIWVEDKMVLKSNYYDRAKLARLAKLAQRLRRTEASLLREALDTTLDQHTDC